MLPPSARYPSRFFSRTLTCCLTFALGALAVAELETRARVQPHGIEIIAGRKAAARQVIVRFRPQAASTSQIGNELDGVVVPLPAGLHLIRSRSRAAADLVAALAGRASVAYVEPDYLVRATATVPNDPLFSQQWFLSNPQTMNADVHAPAAWDVTVGSASRVIGIVDTGIEHAHPDLSANIWTSPAPYTVYLNGGQSRLDCPAGSTGVDVVTGTCSAVDANGHGTAMAGVIGAMANNGIGVSGVNWRARLMDLRFLGPDGTGLVSELINALDVAIQLKQIFGAAADVRVLSNSFTTTGYSQGLSDEIAKTNDAGMLFVAAAGNDGTDSDTAPTYPAGYPLPNVVAVAATTEEDGLASYSNFGATTVHVGAPGDLIPTTTVNGNYWTISGTSPAAAVVSGVAGLVLSECDVSTATIKNLLMQTVDPVAALGGRTVSGGRVNAERALQQCSGGRSAPRVTLTSPANGSRFDEPAAIAVTADAVEPGGTVAQVDFYANSTHIGTVTRPPYTIDWNGVPFGQYSVSALAADAAGATGSSSANWVYVVRRDLPSPWVSADVGATSVAGSASYSSNGVFTVRGSGADVWGTSDAFQYCYQSFSGDGTIVARVASVETVDQWSKAGVMIRETLGASSAHAFMLVSAAKGVSFQRRTASGASSASTTIAGAAPRFVKLTRTGGTITASVSADGAAWTNVGSDTFNMASTVYVGLAVTSHDETRVAQATFDGVSITAAANALPAGWSTSDIGAVGVTGSARESAGTFTVAGAGADVWGTSDAFRYVYRAMSGDGEAVARVDSVQNVAAWTKAGIMIRQSLNANAPHAFMVVSAASGVSFQRRTAAGASSVSTTVAGTAPRWVKLTRSGGTVTASTSIDGTTWTVVGHDTFMFPSSVYVGLAVTSHDATRAATATFSSVGITDAAASTTRSW